MITVKEDLKKDCTRTTEYSAYTQNWISVESLDSEQEKN